MVSELMEHDGDDDGPVVSLKDPNKFSTKVAQSGNVTKHIKVNGFVCVRLTETDNRI